MRNALTVAFAAPVLFTEEVNLDTTYQQLSVRIQDTVHPSSAQRAQLHKLMETRKEGERHLRRQMLTTYSPEQRQRAAALWQQRDRSRALTLDERQALRAKVGISTAQELQFAAYEKKLKVHREQTVYLTEQLLTPHQRELAQDLEFLL